MFDSTKTGLKKILENVDEGKLQLPDFQRDYVWGDDDVKSLISSIARGFPVGALLTLGTGGEVKFKPRLVVGVQSKNVRPSELLLDGQQRITSLYQSTYLDRPVRTRNQQGKEVERFYYIDIKNAISGGADLEQAIIGVPADKIIRKNFGKTIALDLSTRESEFGIDYFPLSLSFDSRDWWYGWRDYWKSHDCDRDILSLERAFMKGVMEKIEHYEMPIIRLDRENSREAICLVFEKVNVGGKKTGCLRARNRDLCRRRI